MPSPRPYGEDLSDLVDEDDLDELLRAKAAAAAPLTPPANGIILPGLQPGHSKRPTGPRELREFTNNITAGLTAVRLISGIATRHMGADAEEAKRVTRGAVLFLKSIVDGINPTDPLEECLATQAGLAHLRSIHFTELLARESDPDRLRVLAEMTERSANTFRKSMLALRDYRSPRQFSVTNIEKAAQVNTANQQVIQSDFSQKQNAPNEQGTRHAQTVHADFAGALEVKRDGNAESPVETVDRPADGSRKSPVKPERSTARRTHSRGPGATGGVRQDDGGAAKASRRTVTATVKRKR